MVKTAIFVDIADPEAVTVITTPFGEQRLKGPFYIVEEGDRSYGAGAAEFTGTHRPLGRNQWLKFETVLGYRIDEQAAVETIVGDNHHETTVVAEPGDWIIQQMTGELMVLKPSAFEERYVAEDEFS